MFSKHPAPTLSAKVAKSPSCDAGLEMHGGAFGGFPAVTVQEPPMEFQPSEWVQIPHLGFFVGLTSAEVIAQRRLFFTSACLPLSATHHSIYAGKQKSFAALWCLDRVKSARIILCVWEMYQFKRNKGDRPQAIIEYIYIDIYRMSIQYVPYKYRIKL